MHTAFMADTGPTTDALAQLLTHPDKQVRIEGRAMANGWMQSAALWAQAELNSGTEPGNVLHALCSLSICLYGSIAAQVARPSGDPVAVELFMAISKDRLPTQIANVRQAMRAKR